MLRPLLVGDAVSLVFEAPEDLPTLHTDEAKVSQILRNFISNALKFTVRGEVRVTAAAVGGGESVVFRVADTGIGIAPEDQERIFQEFTQVDSPLQRHVKGTGLGLPLCRRLAELLGGSVAVESREGVGSAFSATIPTVFGAAADAPLTWHVEPTRTPVLVVEDSPETVLLYEKYLAGSGFQVLPTTNLREARQALAAVRPRAIVLDVLLRGEDSWSFLGELKRGEDTRKIPVLVVTTVEDERKAVALGADAYCVKPIDRHRLLHMLTRITAPDALRRILIVDDEEVSRYLLRQHLMAPEHVIWEATNAEEGMRIAREEHPDVVCLDIAMPDVDGYELLRRLKADPATGNVPVLMVTAQPIDDDLRRRLAAAAGVLSKEGLSRMTALAAVETAMHARAGNV
jgi:CheY-like chemotaxis protein